MTDDLRRAAEELLRSFYDNDDGSIGCNVDRDGIFNFPDDVRALRAALAARSEPEYGDSTPTQHRSDTLGPCLACQHRDAARSEQHSDCAELCACYSRGYHQGLDDALAPENARSEPRAEGRGMTETPNEHLLRLFDEAAEWPTVRAAIRAVLLPETATPPAPVLDVDRLANAWANVMDGRHIPGHQTRIGRDTTTAEDWQAIAREYADLAPEQPE